MVHSRGSRVEVGEQPDVLHAAVAILNAGNISVGGAATGLPPPVAAPNIASLNAASSAAGSANGAANAVTAQQTAPAPENDSSSIISVEVLGYGGGEDDAPDSSNTQTPQAL